MRTRCSSAPTQRRTASSRVRPSNVTAFFSEALDTNLSSLQVLDGDGKRVDDGNTTFGPESVRMQIGIKGTLSPGYYTVVWETLSAVDGHLFKGFYPFTMLNADGTQPTGQAYQGVSAGGTTAQPDTVSVRWARLLGIAALLGTLAFFSWVVSPSLGEVEEPWRTRWRDTARKRLLQVSLVAAAALAVTAVGELYLQAHQVGGLSYLSDVLKNDWGQRWIQRQIVLAGIVVALGVAYYLWKRDRQRLGDVAVWVALAGSLVYVVLLALVSHGDSIPGSFWAVGAYFLHVAAASVWIGMLFQLALFLLWLRQDMPREAKTDLQASHLQRFSTIAATSVIVLLATGAANAAGQIPDWSSLYDTAYGRALLVKLGIMCVLLLAAAANAFYLRPRIVDESGRGQPRRRPAPPHDHSRASRAGAGRRRPLRRGDPRPLPNGPPGPRRPGLRAGQHVRRRGLRGDAAHEQRRSGSRLHGHAQHGRLQLLPGLPLRHRRHADTGRQHAARRRSQGPDEDQLPHGKPRPADRRFRSGRRRPAFVQGCRGVSAAGRAVGHRCHRPAPRPRRRNGHDPGAGGSAGRRARASSSIR